MCTDTYSLSRESFGKPGLGSPSVATPVTCTPPVVLGAAKDRDRALLRWQRDGSLGCICFFILFFFWLKKNSDRVQNFPLGNKGQSQIKTCFWNWEVWTDLLAPAPAARGVSYPSPSPHGHNTWDSTPEALPPRSPPFSWDTSNQLRSNIFDMMQKNNNKKSLLLVWSQFLRSTALGISDAFSRGQFRVTPKGILWDS